LSFLKDAYYNLRFKARTGVTTPKQIAMSMEPTIKHFNFQEHVFSPLVLQEEQETNPFNSARPESTNEHPPLAFFLNKVY